MAYQRAIVSGCVILIAAILGWMLLPHAMVWVVMTAFLACQTTPGTPFRQALMVMILMLVMVFSMFFLTDMVLVTLIVKASMVFVFLGSSYYLFLHRPIKKNDYVLMVLIPLILLFVLFWPIDSVENRKELILGIVVGGLIAILLTGFVFYGRWKRIFTGAMINVLRKYKLCLQSFSSYFKEPMVYPLMFSSKRNQLEDHLYQEIDHYPEWIYESGLNPGLRSGFRYFLIHLESVMELFFSMDYLVARFVNAEIMQSEKGKVFWERVLVVMKNNEALLVDLMRFFEEKPAAFNHVTLSEDILDLEKSLFELVPSNLELLDVSSFNLSIVGFVQDLKEIREELLRLHLSLPNA